MNTKQKFEELANSTLFNNDTSDDFYNEHKCYMDNTSYICDLFTEFADGQIDVYASELFEWAKYNTDKIEEANNELGTPNDIIAQIQQAQFLQSHNELYEDECDIIKKLAFNYICENIEEQEFTSKQIENFITELEAVSSNDRMEEIKNICDNFLNNETTE